MAFQYVKTTTTQPSLVQYTEKIKGGGGGQNSHHTLYTGTGVVTEYVPQVQYAQNTQTPDITRVLTLAKMDHHSSWLWHHAATYVPSLGIL